MQSQFEKHFLSYWEKHFKEHAHNSTLLLSVSGGLDSQVMLHCFQTLLPNQAIRLLHFNFHIRQESALDYEVIKAIAKTDIELIYYYPEDKTRNNETQIRNFRLKIYQEKIDAQQAIAVCCAHHLNDSTETLLFNLSRGTGLKGLTGIQAKTALIWHPMLFASRKDLETYAAQHNLPYISDSTNADIKIKRNRIRQHIIPQFQELNPNFLGSTKQTIYRLSALQKGLEHILSTSKQHLDTHHPNNIPITYILEHPFPEELLMFLYADYGIQYYQAKEAIALLPILDNGKKLYFGRYLFDKQKNCLLRHHHKTKDMKE